MRVIHRRYSNYEEQPVGLRSRRSGGSVGVSSSAPWSLEDDTSLVITEGAPCGSPCSSPAMRPGEDRVRRAAAELAHGRCSSARRSDRLSSSMSRSVVDFLSLSVRHVPGHGGQSQAPWPDVAAAAAQWDREAAAHCGAHGGQGNMTTRAPAAPQPQPQPQPQPVAPLTAPAAPRVVFNAAAAAAALAKGATSPPAVQKSSRASTGSQRKAQAPPPAPIPSGWADAFSTSSEEPPLGCGAFAQIHRATEKATGKNFAVKVMNRSNFTMRGIGAQLDAEIASMRRCAESELCKHVVRLLAVAEEEDHVYLRLELCRCDLLRFATAQPGGRLAEQDAASWARQLLVGLRDLHSLGFLHRDIKPENLLCTFDGVLKIADFGWCADLRHAPSTLAGTFQYMAPEVLGESGLQTEAVDVWSAGATFLQLIVGRPLLTTNLAGGVTGLSQTDPMSATKVKTSWLLDEIHQKCPPSDDDRPSGISWRCWDLLRRTLEPEVSERVSVSDALAHPWLLEARSPPPGLDRLPKASQSAHQIAEDTEGCSTMTATKARGEQQAPPRHARLLRAPTPARNCPAPWEGSSATAPSKALTEATLREAASLPVVAEEPARTRYCRAETARASSKSKERTAAPAYSHPASQASQSALAPMQAAGLLGSKVHDQELAATPPPPPLSSTTEAPPPPAAVPTRLMRTRSTGTTACLLGGEGKDAMAEHPILQECEQQIASMVQELERRSSLGAAARKQALLVGHLLSSGHGQTKSGTVPVASSTTGASTLGCDPDFRTLTELVRTCKRNLRRASCGPSFESSESAIHGASSSTARAGRCVSPGSGARHFPDQGDAAPQQQVSVDALSRTLPPDFLSQGRQASPQHRRRYVAAATAEPQVYYDCSTAHAAAVTGVAAGTAGIAGTTPGTARHGCISPRTYIAASQQQQQQQRQQQHWEHWALPLQLQQRQQLQLQRQQLQHYPPQQTTGLVSVRPSLPSTTSIATSGAQQLHTFRCVVR